MPGTIASAPTTRGMILNWLRSHAPLTALVGGAHKIVTQAGSETRPAEPPFVLVRHEGGGVWAFEAHDTPAHRTATIDRVISELSWLFTQTRFATPTETRERPISADPRPPTGEVADQGYGTIKRIARATVFYRQY